MFGYISYRIVCEDVLQPCSLAKKVPLEVAALRRQLVGAARARVAGAQRIELRNQHKQPGSPLNRHQRDYLASPSRARRGLIRVRKGARKVRVATPPFSLCGQLLARSGFAAVARALRPNAWRLVLRMDRAVGRLLDSRSLSVVCLACVRRVARPSQVSACPSLSGLGRRIESRASRHVPLASVSFW
jgi:hypothetical protein